MAEIILIIIALVMIANGEGGTVLWIGVVILALIVLDALFPGKKGAGKTYERPRTRIYHPHVVEEDDYECGICGYRFSKADSSCPHCGVRFNCAVTDEEEYDEEEDELEDMEEEGW